jgi:hypothetical protein
MTWECGKSGRTFKSAIIWSVAESGQTLREEVGRHSPGGHRRGEDELHIEESQKRQLTSMSAAPSAT